MQHGVYSENLIPISSTVSSLGCSRGGVATSKTPNMQPWRLQGCSHGCGYDAVTSVLPGFCQTRLLPLKGLRRKRPSTSAKSQHDEQSHAGFIPGRSAKHPQTSRCFASNVPPTFILFSGQTMRTAVKVETSVHGVRDTSHQLSPPNQSPTPPSMIPPPQ